MRVGFQPRSAPSRIADGPASNWRTRISIVAFARLLFWPIALFTLAALVLELGYWRKEFNIVGPFAAATDPAGHSLVLAIPQQTAQWWAKPLLGDDDAHPNRSDLTLGIGGYAMG